MDNLNEVNRLKPNEYPEIILEYQDRNYTYAEIKMNITKKRELVEYREKKKNNNSPFENVLFIFFDAISRVQFQRVLPKTTKFFEQFMKYNPNSKYKSYHFSKYHSLDGYTRINLQPMFFGYNMGSGRGTYIIRYFKQNGFITGQSMGSCSKETYIFGNNYTSNLQFENYDHENVGMFCDPNYFDRERPYSINKGEYCLLRRCLYGKDVHDYVLDYGKLFWETYKDNRKFLRLYFIDPHETSGEVAKYVDTPLYNFLSNLYQRNLFEKTIIFLISDHGLHMSGIYQAMKTEDYNIEKYLPMLIILIHDYKDNDNNLIDNQDILISAYDIHNTLMYCAFGIFNQFDRGSNIFGYINANQRNCSSIGIDKATVCKCVPKSKM